MTANLLAQTCCSGGVPLSANLGLPPGEANIWQFSLNYDHHVLNTLMSESDRLDDESRLRITRSLIFQSSYGISKTVSIDFFLPYIFQERTIEQFGNISNTNTRGIGDMAVLVKYNFLASKPKYDLLIGAGPKIPTGRTDLSRKDGIRLSADLQPGSGSWDGLVYGLFTSQIGFRRSMSYSLSTVYSLKGTNDSYFDTQSYGFGNEFMVVVSFMDNLLISKELFGASLSFRYRTQQQDRIDGNTLSNTGGEWLFLTPGVAYFFNPNWSVNLSGDIPLYANIEGTQLTTTYRLNAGIYLKIPNRKNRNEIIKF